MDDAAEALRQRRDEWITVVNRGDLEAYAALLAEDAVWLPPGQAAIVGRAAIRRWLEPFLEQYAYAFSVDVEHVRIAGAWAVERGRFLSRTTPKIGAESIEHAGRYLVLWRRDTGRAWEIERYIDETPGA